MGLNIHTINEFAKLIEPKKEEKKEFTYYGTVKSIIDNANVNVAIDGSMSVNGEQITTPCKLATNAKPTDRVIVTIKNRQAIVTSTMNSI